MDLVSAPELAQAILQKVEQHTTRLALATAESGVDVLCFYDDAGMQRGMQLAPALWRQFVKPSWQRVLDAVRTRFPDVRFFLHCCGKIEAIVPDIAELGFHVLHPDSARVHGLRQHLRAVWVTHHVGRDYFRPTDVSFRHAGSSPAGSTPAL